MKDLINIYQTRWSKGIVELGKSKGDIVASKKLATDFINYLYDFKNGTVLSFTKLAILVVFACRLAGK